MQLIGLADLLEGDEAFHEIVEELRNEHDQTVNMLRAARPYLLATLARDWDGPLIYLTAHVKRAYNTVEQLPVWIPDAEDAPRVLRYNEPIPQFYERSPWGDEVIHGRIGTLAALLEDDAPQQPLVVSSVRALMQRTMPVSQFRKGKMTIKVGNRYATDKLLEHWHRLGYEPKTVVVEPGTFSRRGGVLDVFPIDAARPVRIDFFDDEIDTLKTFDPSTQRSDAKLDSVVIPPAREALPEYGQQVARHLADWFKTLPEASDDMTAPGTDAEPLSNGANFPYLEHYLPYFYPNPISLLDYAPDNALIVVEDWDELRETVQELQEEAETRREEQITAQQLAHDHPVPYVDWETLETDLKTRTLLHLTNTASFDPSSAAQKLGARFMPGGRFGGQLRKMLSDLRRVHHKGDSIVVVTEQAERLKQIWYEQDSSEFIPTLNTLDKPPEPGSLVFVHGTMQEGWSLRLEGQTPIHLLTDAEIFGWSRPEPRRRKTTRTGKPPEADYSDWQPGDYVVHVDYGIGQFGGMRHRTVDGNEREYLLINYEGTDMIFVPIHQADRVTKYVGADDTPPALSKLGKPDWQRAKSRAEKAVEEEARELLDLYATRERTPGHAFSPDTPWQHELEASFPYVETDDQLRSLRDVKADMETTRPMDRLICGDVGYGKTEVALRAAFKAVMDGKQVAVLVPTTVLAQQHYDTFRERLAPFPVKIEMMSRFRTGEEQSRALPQIASGEVDVVIGTHRLLSKDITFNELGLVIIDEEQRFGVKHKEHLKALRHQVDVLTLTATPIPRTLYMSLNGIRDISMIQTPPEERLPVITHVGRFDEHLIRQAILREMERGGQVFIVHNRVKTIETLRQRIENIVPEARIIVGHGQMSERQLASVMTAFAHNKYDVLIATTIIENGIDIPNANTLIVDHANQMGLAQLYQLRGRVGRSAQQGFAYFFHPSRVTSDAKSRLETLAENNSLGAGFNIAMRDLELRGAGDILSTRQTGQVAAVGLHLYSDLLKQAIKRLRGDSQAQEEDEPLPVSSTRGIVIDLPLAAYLPTDWIPDIALRLQVYRRIAALHTMQEVESMHTELLDRFGQLPEAVENLLYQIQVKLLAQRANATHCIANRGTVQIKLPYLGEVNRPALEQKLGEDVQVSRTAVTFPLDDDQMWKDRLLEMLETLAAGIESGSRLKAGV